MAGGCTPSIRDSTVVLLLQEVVVGSSNVVQLVVVGSRREVVGPVVVVPRCTLRTVGPEEQVGSRTVGLVGSHTVVGTVVEKRKELAVDKKEKG